jgi:hypothetical protein
MIRKAASNITDFFIAKQVVDAGEADEFYLSVRDMEDYDYTGDRKISSSTATYYLDYTQGTAYAGQEMRLRGRTYLYYVNVGGYWYS